jgi:hypothetical protein
LRHSKLAERLGFTNDKKLLIARPLVLDVAWVSKDHSAFRIQAKGVVVSERNSRCDLDNSSGVRIL